ncbi:MAG: DUF3237 domain-containing protein [Proteobacteria bacterium]|nr:DUF3237 domain-containing protein [Pseudomonadota bacterium]
MPELKSEFLFTITVTVDEFHDFGAVPSCTRHVDILGKGKFEGPRLRGQVLPGGMDMKTIRADGAMNPNVRLMLKTDDGALIFMHYTGVRHGSPEVMARIAAGEVVPPSEYYLRNTPYFETSAKAYDWLNRIVAVGVGRRMPDHAVYEVFQIL